MESNNKRQFVKYSFYQVEPTWRRLPDKEKEEGTPFIRADMLVEGDTLRGLGRFHA